MSPLRFYDVNLDVKKTILSYITRPEDLKSLCLSCKQLQEIATPLLYQKVFLCIGGNNDVRVSGLISRTNPGTQYIRKVYLQLEKNVAPEESHVRDSSDDSSEEEQEVKLEAISSTNRQAQFTTRLLLDFLPNDALKKFSWQDWEPFSLENFVLLIKKQRRLKEIEIESVDRPLMPLLRKHPKLLEDFKELTSLHLYPDNLDRLQACQQVLQGHPDITELQLCSDFSNSRETVPNDLHDSSTQPGLITRTIFGHFLPFADCTPLQLKVLVIDNLDLRFAADTYMKFINFSNLEYLSIGSCVGADAVFSQLSRPHIRPAKLRKLRWFHEEANEPHALESFEGLLEATVGLTVLHIDTNNIESLPRAGAIAHHGKTLQSLCVRGRIQHFVLMTYESEQFDEICSNCLELRQLSITFPQTSVSDAHPSDDFLTYLRSGKKLRHLVTINFHEWPKTQSTFFGRNRHQKLKPQWYDLYEHGLQRLAQQIFEASDNHSSEQGWGLGHRSMLSVIAFGANGRTAFDDTYHNKLKQVPFVRGTRVDAFGNRSMMAVKTVWKVLQFVEPESDILNYALYDVHDAHNNP